MEYVTNMFKNLGDSPEAAAAHAKTVMDVQTRLAGASLVVRPSRTGVHVGAIAGVLAGVTATTILNQSLASTLDYWMAGQYPGGVFVTEGAGFSLQPQEPIAPAVVSRLRSSSDVTPPLA